MNTSDLATQVTVIIARLHGLLDDIGVAASEREAREQQVFTAISITLTDHLSSVAAQKEELIKQSEQLIHHIRLLEVAIYDRIPPEALSQTPPVLSKPLSQYVQDLREKHLTISRLYQDRLDQVNRLVTALNSYTSHLEAGFLQIELPPIDLDASNPTDFSLSPSYLQRLDNEFDRVHNEYNTRLETVQKLGKELVTLWAELGTPQDLTDSLVIRHHRESPEQLGLRSDDISQLRRKLAGLQAEKLDRESQLADLIHRVESLWELLQVDDRERRTFTAANRGFGMRVINEYEAELDRLHEQKRQHLGLFVEDARCRIQQLWDDLYFSEEEMIEFTPAFQDIPTDALLAAHETEIERLQALRQQRAPILDLLTRYRTLIQEREDLATSSQDASRLMLKGTKGEKRDPTRLLREEKMRKRIAKELPRVTQDLRYRLELWEMECDRPFLVRGVRFLEEMEEESVPKSNEAARPKTPSMAPPPSRSSRPIPQTQSRALVYNRSAAPSRTETRAPLQPCSEKAMPISTFSASSASPYTGRQSPTKIPAARKTPTHLVPQAKSPRRHITTTATSAPHDLRQAVTLPIAPPPRLRLHTDQQSIDHQRCGSPQTFENGLSYINDVNSVHSELTFESQGSRRVQRIECTGNTGLPRVHGEISSRQPSATSATTVSGSENWETYDDGYEQDAVVPQTVVKAYDHEFSMTCAPIPHHQKHVAIIRGPVQIYGESGRVASGSEAGWTDASGDVF